MVSDHYCLREVLCVLGRIVTSIFFEILAASLKSTYNENCSVLWIIQANQDTVFGKTHYWWIMLMQFSNAFHLPCIWVAAEISETNIWYWTDIRQLEATDKYNFCYLGELNFLNSTSYFFSPPFSSLSYCSGFCFFHFLSLTYSHSIYFSFNPLNSLFVLLSLSPDSFFLSFFLKVGSDRCNHLWDQTCHSEGSWGHCLLNFLLLRLQLIIISFYFLFHIHITPIWFLSFINMALVSGFFSLSLSPDPHPCPISFSSLPSVFT